MIKKNNWILLPIIILEILEQVENNCWILLIIIFIILEQVENIKIYL